jgi:hypothetical protein
VDVFYGHILMLNIQKGEAWIPEQTSYFNKLLLLTNQPAHQASFIQRNTFSKVGLYDESLRIAGDYDWFLKAFLQFHCTYRYYNFVCTVFVRGGLSNASDLKIMTLNKKERTQIISRYYGLFMRSIYYNSFLYWRLFHLNIVWYKILRKVL